MASGETNPERLADRGDDRLRCSREELVDSLNGSLEPIHREILKLYLERLNLLDEQIGKLDQMIATALQRNQEAVIRVAGIPGFGADSAQQLIADVGPMPKPFLRRGTSPPGSGCAPGQM